MIDEYARSVFSALLKDLSDIEYESFSGYGENRKSNGMKIKRPGQNEIEVFSFPQTWSSTALGFGGVGGQAFTTALTVVVVHFSEACIYFGGTFAYRIKKVNHKFFEDLKAFDMHEVAGARGRYEHGL